jgi:hypothetical protein
MAEVLDANNIWRKMTPAMQEILVNLFNHQTHGVPLPQLMLPTWQAYEIRDYLLFMGICYIPSADGRLVLTYLGRLLVQTCADVKGL